MKKRSTDCVIGRMRKLSIAGNASEPIRRSSASPHGNLLSGGSGGGSELEAALSSDGEGGVTTERGDAMVRGRTSRLALAGAVTLPKQAADVMHAAQHSSRSGARTARILQ